jgi:hypothetical protein
MSAKIVISGMEITVPVTELGEAVRQLAPWLPTKAAEPAPTKRPDGTWPFPMGDVQRPHGADVAVASPAAKPSLAQAVLPLVSPLAAAKGSPVPSDAPTVAVRLFRALVSNRATGGMRPEEVMPLVGTVHPKGIGNRMQGINALLREIGIPAEEVYSNARNELGSRMWMPKARTAEAIKVIEEKYLPL